ncbi:MAG: hypothetical protein JWL81_2428 [Verrucomicrobiales bacterium]|nr:hypothetical protein [Verrucomicrobiales bacterium]
MKTLVLKTLACLVLAAFLPSCASPVGNGALIGSAAGAVGGYAYDRAKGDHPEDRNNGDTLRRVGGGAALGAVAGGGIGALTSRPQPAPQYQGYPAPQYQGYPQGAPAGYGRPY